MADWKEKGYVPDSDEEDESQDSINKELPTANHEVDDNDDQGPHQTHEHEDDGIGNEEKDGDYREPQNEAEVPKSHDLEKPNADDDREMDELQQDQYRDAAGAQSQAEPAAQLSAQLFPESGQGASPSPAKNSSQHNVFLVSRASSVLSDAPSSLPDFSTLLRPRMEEDVKASEPNDMSHVSTSSPKLDPGRGRGLDEDQNELPETGRAGRTFRHRNPIQLHPYLIEKQKYNQAHLARGLRPIRFQEEVARALRQEENTQDFECFDGEEDTRNPSPPTRTATSPSSQNPEREEMFNFGDDEEFPDINTLLWASSRDFTTCGHKRQKMDPGFRRPPRLSPQRQSTLGPDRAGALTEDDNAMFSVPPSPPLSRSQTPVGPSNSVAPRFRVPPRIPSPNLPTPVTSSEPRRRQPRQSSRSEDPDAQSPIAHPANDASGVEDSSSEDEVTHQLGRAQRRIKGVLPASWLKLDLRTQAKKPQQDRGHPTSTSPEKNSHQRGVARPVMRHGSKTPSRLTSRQEIFVLSDDDSVASDADQPLQRSPLRTGVDLFADDQSIFTSRCGEAMEDDRVDAMLPPVTRPRNHPNRARKHHTRIADFGAQKRQISLETRNGHQKQRAHQPKINSHFQKAKARLESRPRTKLSILDAPRSQAALDTPQPAFMKIAARTARQRHNKGRHTPSRKFLRLESREDTQDVDETLRAWREGTIAPSVEYDSHVARPPLQPRSTNNAAPFGSPELPNSPRQTKIAISAGRTVQPRPRSTKQSKLQSSLDKLVRNRHTPERLDVPAQEAHPYEDWRKRGQLKSKLQTFDDSRPAVLESSQTEQDRLHPQSAFRRGLSIFNKSSHESRISKPVLDRFLGGGEDPLEVVNTAQRPSEDARLEATLKVTTQTRPPRHRKRSPQRLDVSDLRSRESISPVIVDELPDDDIPTILHGTSNIRVLTGLGPFGTRYTSTFDVTPLQPGAHFHQSTFLGSGDFQRSLQLRHDCNLDNPRGSTLLTCGSQTFRWGPWNETISSELGKAFERIGQGARSLNKAEPAFDVQAARDAISLLKAVILYFSAHLSFLDPIDRISFLQRCRILVYDLWDPSVANMNEIEENKKFANQIFALDLVLANQLRQISEHHTVSPELNGVIQGLVAASAKRAFSAIKKSISDFDRCLSMSKRLRHAESVIQEDHSTIETFVIAHHVLRQAGLPMLDIWNILCDRLPATSTDKSRGVDLNERSWRQLFVLLPFLELNDQGVLEIGRRFKSSLGNWTWVKALVNPVLETYIANPRGQRPGFNTYCRAVFSRCLHLINGWGWYRCDSIIGTLFDFFAKNNLGHLRNEESHGSPLFLESLNKNPPLDADPEDRCFHLLLKIIGSGIKHMRQLYPPKKIRDLAWRLMPNHGRSHPKEQAIRQEDLDALRNHHDLLCTLYWASPTEFRPSLGAVRTLVDLERSHREACHISIRAWFNLVKFQLSTDEPVESLQPFTQWHTDFLQQMLRQHSLARTEAEDQVKSAQYVGGLSISKELLESTIAKNQRQVEAVLSDALVCLELAIKAAKTQGAAELLLSPAIIGVFDLFDSSKTQSSGIVTKAMDVVLAYTSKSSAKSQQVTTHSENDDSQDYGDWSAFNDDDAVEIESAKDASAPLEKLMGPLRHLLSNCFGADTMPHESLLIKLIDVWVAVSHVLVEDGLKSWDDYLGQFGNDSWNTLRDTDQTRKYTAYFFAALTETDVRIYRHNRLSILASWLGSLVERESLLKFQHKLTNALLNADLHDALLTNLPFWKNPSTRRFEITPIDFSERRLSLISSILSNMRISLENATFDPTIDFTQFKQEYKDLLKHLMTTMKHNYSELGHGSNLKGAYVDFVHRIVELLQEHASSICPVDRFFTDDAAFPLPATDPTYVVGQLKNYGLRLLDSKTPKQLAVFLQSVSERAAADGQQAYLVEQLSTAMSNAFEDGSSKPTLRAFLVKAIVPAYIQMAFQTPVGWVLAMPFLQALQKVFGRIAVDLDGFNTGSVDAIRSTMIAFMSFTQSAMTPLLNQPHNFDSPSVLKLLTACYDVITALLPTLDYLLRLKALSTEDPALQHVAIFKAFADQTRLTIARRDPDEMPEMDRPPTSILTIDTVYTDIRKFATHELKDALNKHWTRVGADHFVTRGSLRREVVVDIRPLEEEKEALMGALQGFGECLGRLPVLRTQDEVYEAVRRRQRDEEFVGVFF